MNGRRLDNGEPKVTEKLGRRRVIGKARIAKLIDCAERGGVPRVELVHPGSWAPIGDPTVVASDANSALHEAQLPWTAHAENGRVWIEGDAR